MVVSYADLDSGTMRSVEFALKMGKPIYVLPHRLNESIGTNELLKKEQAQAIYDIDEFVHQFIDIPWCENMKNEDEFLLFCKNNPTVDDAISKYGELVYEYELCEKISIKNGKVFAL